MIRISNAKHFTEDQWAGILESGSCVILTYGGEPYICILARVAFCKYGRDWTINAILRKLFDDFLEYYKRKYDHEVENRLVIECMGISI